MIATMSKHHAADRGFDDALMFDWRGQVAEATGANAFFIRDGKIYTPTPDCFLNGITRQTVIELARKRGIEVEERVIWPDELESFEQFFLTGSAAEIRSEEHTSELQQLMRTSYAVFCLKTKKQHNIPTHTRQSNNRTHQI